MRNIDSFLNIIALSAVLWIFHFLSGCYSCDPCLLNRDGHHLKDTSALDYKIAILPFEIEDLKSEDFELDIKENAEKELQEYLVKSLNDFNTAEKVFASDKHKQAMMYDASADLLVLPKLHDIQFSYIEVTSRWPATIAFWYITWLGGFYVEDCSYELRMEISCDLVDPHTGFTIVKDLKLATEKIDLTFWERNPFISWGTLQSMILPPFWTSDNLKIRNESLTHRAFDLIAAQLKNYLKERLPNEESIFIATKENRIS